MERRVYKVSPLLDEWVVEQDNLIIRASSQHSAIEMAETAARYDQRLGQDAEVLLAVSEGEWKSIWPSRKSAEALDRNRSRLRARMH